MKRDFIWNIPFTTYPKKLARTPVNIINGPAAAVINPRNPRTSLRGLGSLLVNLIIPSTTFINVVLIFKNCSPIDARSAFNPSTARRYLPEADSVTCANSRPAIFARSCELAFIKSITCNVWEPCFPRLANNAFIRANWNLPNSCSIACCFCSGFNLSNAPCSSKIVPVRFPAFFVTISFKLIPNP